MLMKLIISELIPTQSKTTILHSMRWIPLPGVYREKPVEIDKFEPNQFGLYNMHGNVSEWCFDVYGEYDAARNDNPSGPAEVSSGLSGAADGMISVSIFAHPTARQHPRQMLFSAEASGL